VRVITRKMDALGRAAMLQAAAHGDWSTVVRMFEATPPAESAAAASAADLFGRTTWHWLAAAAPRSTAVDLVRHLQAPIAASARTKSQENILHWLFDVKRLLVEEDCELCRAIVAAGADPLERNTDGLSATDLLRSRVEASSVDAVIAARCLGMVVSAGDTARSARTTPGGDAGAGVVAPLSSASASAGSLVPTAAASGGKKKLTVKLKK
jgi:methylthioribose-1-phosphate isomerase